MKKIKSKLSLAVFCLLISLNGIAQQKISNVININFNNINAIKEGEKIKGYYVFYKADKVKGGEYSYRLEILNENAEEVAKKRITASKYLFLVEASYNQELLCFKFYDMKEKRITLRFYNEQAEKVATKSYEPSKMERQMLTISLKQGTENTSPSITPVEKSGFLVTSFVKNSKIGYEINYYPNDKEQKKWKYGSKSNSPLVEMATILDANKDVVIASVITRKGIMSKDVDFQIMALDIKTGKELFKKRADSPRYEESITNSYYDEDKKEIILIGYYFKKGDKPLSDPSLGVVMKTLDLSGKEIESSYTSWSKDIAKFLGSSKKGKLDDIGFVFFHQFVKMDDGRIYGVGESYRKTVSAAGSAMKVLALAGGSTGATSAFQITVGDFYIFEFDKDKKIQGVEVVEKSVSRVGLPNGAGLYGPQVLALMVKAYGGFDFEYLKTINNGKTFAVFYRNYEKIKGEKNKSIAGVISNTNDEYLVDKIDIPTEATYVKVLPAADGNILFLEYFKKTKKLELNFKKMNY